MTDAEQKLWYKIRKKQLGVKFRRQQPIGRYIVDFVCFDKRLIIELDGGQHYQSLRDAARDRWFADQGYNILRFWNNEVLQNIDGVIAFIMQNISPSPLSPPLYPLPSREGIQMEYRIKDWRGHYRSFP